MSECDYFGSSDGYTPTADGYGPGWVWGGHENGWCKLPEPESQAPTLGLAELMVAHQQQAQHPPKLSFFEQANQIAMNALVGQWAGQQVVQDVSTPSVVDASGSSTWSEHKTASEAGSTYEAYSHANNQGAPDAGYGPGWVWGGHENGWCKLPEPEYGATAPALASQETPTRKNHAYISIKHGANVSSQDIAASLAASLSAHNSIPGGVPALAAEAGQALGAQSSRHSANAALTTALTIPPRERPPGQWADIAAVWQDRQDEPYRLMQTMVEFGFDAADIAYATAQSAQAVGDYLTRHGAPAGFGGAATLGQEVINAAYVQALNQAIQQPHNPQYAELLRYQPLPSNVSDAVVRDPAAPWWVMVSHTEHDNNHQWSYFDVEAFTQWYVTQNSELAQAFSRIHQSAHVSFVTDHDSNTSMRVGLNSGATLELSRPSLQGPDGNETRVWSSSSVGLIGAGQGIQAYLTYPAAPQAERQALQHMVLQDPVSQEILRLYGQPLELPQTEQGERMRARYGSELATKLLQLSSATEQVRSAYNAALEAAMHQGDHLKDLRTSTYAVQLTSMDTQVVDAQYPWWTTTYHRDYDNNYQWSSFDIQAFHQWYIKQDTPQSRLFVALHGSNITVEARTQRDHDDDAKVWNEYYVGDGQSWGITLGNKSYVNDYIGEQWVPGGISASLRNGLAPISLANPPALYDNSLVFFDPVMGFVTLVENIKPPKPDFFEQIIPIVIVAAVAWFSAGTLGPEAAVSMGLGTSTTTAAGVTTYTLSTAGLIASGAVAGAATALVSGAFNGNLTLKGVLKGALSGALTAGLLQGLKEYLPNIPAGELRDAIAFGGRITIQGAVQAITGGSFRDGALVGVVNGLADAVGASIDLGIKEAGLSVNDAIATRFFGRLLTSAIRVAANPDNPGYAFASAFINDLVQQAGGPVTVHAGSTPTPGVVSQTVFDDEGNLNPGIVDTSLTPAQQRQQIYDRLIQQGISPQDANQQVQQWASSGGQAAFNAAAGGGGMAPAMDADGSTTNGVHNGWTWALGGDGRYYAVPPGREPGEALFGYDALGQYVAVPPVVVPTSAEDRQRIAQINTTLEQQGITHIGYADEFVSPLTAAQAFVAQQTGLIFSDADAQQLVQLGGQGQLAWWRDVVTTPSPTLAGAGALPWTLSTLTAGGSRVLLAGGELLAEMTQAARGLSPWALLVIPGNAQQQIVNLNDRQRFVTRPGELYGSLQQLGPDGQWFTSASGVALVDIGGGQRVALTPEQLAELNRPLTTPNNPQPNTPLINVPLPPQDQPSPLMPGQSTDQVAPPTTTTTPAEPTVTWEDLIIASSSDTNVGIVPNADIARVDPEKLTSYALNLDHPVGGNKAVELNR